MISSAAAPAVDQRRHRRPRLGAGPRSRGAPVARAGGSGIVRSVAWAMKASVPSDPMIRWARMSTGRSWSTNALML